MTMHFSDVSPDIAELVAMRDRLMMDAFYALEKSHRLLADMLVCRMGSRVDAARWMCKHQAPFRGLTAYDVIADGDMDAIWDEVAML